VVFSPTALEDFRSCPRKYYYKGVLGLDEGLFAQLLGVRGASPARGTSGLSSLDKGTLAHRILQSLEFGADPGSWRQTAARCVETFPLDVPAADRAEVEQRVTAFASSPLGRSLASQRLRRELPFLLRLDGAAEYHLTGAMDLVAEGEQSVTVIDYKYAAGAKGAPEGYRFQVGAYMLALSKAYPDREIGGKLVFLGDGEVLPVEVDLPRFEAELVAIMDRIRGLRDEEEFTPLTGCDGASCPFRERCFTRAPQQF
jgi:CRISPR/Cas system-associated exonuclease Cas4 (RecB family)